MREEREKRKEKEKDKEEEKKKEKKKREGGGFYVRGLTKSDDTQRRTRARSARGRSGRERKIHGALNFERRGGWAQI